MASWLDLTGAVNKLQQQVKTSIEKSVDTALDISKSVAAKQATAGSFFGDGWAWDTSSLTSGNSSAAAGPAPVPVAAAEHDVAPPEPTAVSAVTAVVSPAPVSHTYMGEHPRVGEPSPSLSRESSVSDVSVQAGDGDGEAKPATRVVKKKVIKVVKTTSSKQSATAAAATVSSGGEAGATSGTQDGGGVSAHATGGLDKSPSVKVKKAVVVPAAAADGAGDEQPVATRRVVRTMKATASPNGAKGEGPRAPSPATSASSSATAAATTAAQDATPSRMLRTSSTGELSDASVDSAGDGAGPPLGRAAAAAAGGASSKTATTVKRVTKVVVRKPKVAPDTTSPQPPPPPLPTPPSAPREGAGDAPPLLPTVPATPSPLAEDEESKSEAHKVGVMEAAVADGEPQGVHEATVQEEDGAHQTKDDAASRVVASELVADGFAAESIGDVAAGVAAATPGDAESEREAAVAAAEASGGRGGDFEDPAAAAAAPVEPISELAAGAAAGPPPRQVGLEIEEVASAVGAEAVAADRSSLTAKDVDGERLGEVSLLHDRVGAVASNFVVDEEPVTTTAVAAAADDADVAAAPTAAVWEEESHRPAEASEPAAAGAGAAAEELLAAVTEDDALPVLGIEGLLDASRPPAVLADLGAATAAAEPADDSLGDAMAAAAAAAAAAATSAAVAVADARPDGVDDTLWEADGTLSRAADLGPAAEKPAEAESASGKSDSATATAASPSAAEEELPAGAAAAVRKEELAEIAAADARDDGGVELLDPARRAMAPAVADADAANTPVVAPAEAVTGMAAAEGARGSAVSPATAALLTDEKPLAEDGGRRAGSVTSVETAQACANAAFLAAPSKEWMGTAAGAESAAGARTAASVAAGVASEEVDMLNKALYNAAQQSQLKADELARLEDENSLLRAELKRLQQENDEKVQQELEALQEEMQQRLGAAERKVYALTKERDALKRESSRKADASALIKEKDAIIEQIMAEGEALSKKQASFEQTIKKLRGQVKDVEGERDKLAQRLEAEEVKFEALRREKAALEDALKAATEQAAAEVADAKSAGEAAVARLREALAAAEKRADSVARANVEGKLREAAERERALSRALEELRETMSHEAQQAAFREDLLRKDMELLRARCEAAEERHEELAARVPDATRPLLRQIEAMEEAAAVKQAAWAGVERALAVRAREAEAAAAAAEERERLVQERLAQAQARLAAQETHSGSLREENAVAGKALDEERARVTELRSAVAAAREAAAAAEARAAAAVRAAEQRLLEVEEQLEKERVQREELGRQLERARGEADKLAAAAAVSSAAATGGGGGGGFAGHGQGRVASADGGGDGVPADDLGEGLVGGLSILTSMGIGGGGDGELQSALSIGSSPRQDGKARRTMSIDRRLLAQLPPTALVERVESVLRAKEAELELISRRVESLEGVRTSLADELVASTMRGEQLAREAARVPLLEAEIAELTRRHASALELMGERDELVDELRADLEDVKYMYRDQISMLIAQVEELRRGGGGSGSDSGDAVASAGVAPVGGGAGGGRAGGVDVGALS